jgi:hypothetical protein
MMIKLKGHFENEWTSIATKSPFLKPASFTLAFVFGVLVFALGVNEKI